MSKNAYACPCCGYLSLEMDPLGSFENCRVCGWKNDPVQVEDPDYRGGANSESLREAQQAFLAIKTETPDEPRDPTWQALSPQSKDSRETPLNESPRFLVDPYRTPHEQPGCLPADLLARLNRLADEPAPKELAIGAMCYRMGAAPKREEYVCPKCGERTLYSRSRDCSEVQDVRTASGLMKELGRCDIVLDESSFCKHCSPDITAPSMALVVQFANGTEHRNEKIRLVDVQLVKEFFGCHGKHDGGMVGEEPLKKYVSRLALLLLPPVMAKEFRAAHSPLGKLKSAIKKTLGGS